ncbi:MBL fold metallo-hydrolase [Xylophilus sp.]|uniref:MBL fold metallo-hydrolase n=1 Tax=Xylophilus sp. TaxID=2653893 RepID=UPI002D805C59|nr:MBL fold metallo-hydrolase [Xylophilus sp.]
MAVVERGWLSANAVLFDGAAGTAIVDTGYGTHAAQTVALVRDALDASGPGRTLDRIVNTHLHSDHCGGNAALQAAWPQARTAIPPGQAAQVAAWDEQALGYAPTGQQCPRFHVDELLVPGGTVALGDQQWQVHAAPGHDPHAVVLFEPASRTLLSGDALWRTGFGVVFPEIEGGDAFGAVAATLDLIESLAPAAVVPGHGPAFTDVADALSRARRRLDGFVRTPERHAHYAAKVLLKFKLLELQRAPLAALVQWALATEYFGLLAGRYFPDRDRAAWIGGLVADLQAAGAARLEGGAVVNM